MTIRIKRHEAMALSGGDVPMPDKNFSLAIFLSPIVVAKLQFFAPNLLFLRIWRQWRSVARTLISQSMHSSIIDICMLPSAYIVFMTFSKLLFITLFSTKRKEVNDVTLRRRS